MTHLKVLTLEHFLKLAPKLCAPISVILLYLMLSNENKQGNTKLLINREHITYAKIPHTWMILKIIQVKVAYIFKRHFQLLLLYGISKQKVVQTIEVEEEWQRVVYKFWSFFFTAKNLKSVSASPNHNFVGAYLLPLKYWNINYVFGHSS